MYELSKTVEKPPLHARQELYDYAEFLLNKFNNKNKKRAFKFDWACGLKELNSEYNSVELQHSILDMWNE